MAENDAEVFAELLELPVILHLDAVHAHDLDAALNSVQGRVLGAASAFVVACDQTLVQLVVNDPVAAARLERRVAPRPLFLLTRLPGGAGSEEPSQHVLHHVSQRWRSVKEGERPDLFARLRQVDLYPQADLSAPEGWHFRAPSGRHADRFLRVADLIQGAERAQAFAFWLSTRLSTATSVVVDTWAISPPVILALGSNAADPGRRVLGLPGHSNADRVLTERVLRKAYSRSGDRQRVTLVVSISSSGTLVQQCREILREIAGFDCLDVISLFAFHNATDAGDVLCTLNHEVRNFSPDDCALCKQEVPLLDVDPALYYVAAVTERHVRIQKPHTEVGRRFVDRYGGVQELFSMHKRGNRGAHHGWYIDVARLMATQGFIDDLGAALEPLPPSPVILVGNREHAKHFAGLIRDRIGGEVIAMAQDFPSRAEVRALVPKLAQAHVIVADDVTIYRERFQTFNRLLRELDPSPLSINYMTALARMPRVEDWEGLKVSLTKHQEGERSLSSIAHIYLPAPDHGCPWCREERTLRELSKVRELPDTLNQRLSLLERAATAGLTDPFLDAREPVSRLSRGSLIGAQGLSPVATMFAYTCAVQVLRSQANAKRGAVLSAGFPVWQAFDADTLAPGASHGFDEVNVRNFDEALLRACALKILNPSDWGTSRSRGRVRELLLEALGATDQHELVGEILIFLLSCGASANDPVIDELLTLWDT